MSHHLRRNAVAYLALFVALSGTSYAAAKLERNSVGPAQLRTGAVTSVDVRNGSLLRKDFRSGQLPAGAVGAPGPAGSAGSPGPKGDPGAKGADGAPGQPGAAGKNGVDGDDGAPGPPGAVGPTFVAQAGGLTPTATPDATASAATFTTTRAGRIYAYGHALLSIGCSTGPLQAGLYLDDVPISGSARTFPDGTATSVQIVATTSASVAAGAHDVRLKYDCPGGTLGTQSTQQAVAGAILLGT